MRQWLYVWDLSVVNPYSPPRLDHWSKAAKYLKHVGLTNGTEFKWHRCHEITTTKFMSHVMCFYVKFRTETCGNIYFNCSEFLSLENNVLFVSFIYVSILLICSYPVASSNWANVDLLWIRSSDIQLRTISMETLKPSNIRKLKTSFKYHMIPLIKRGKRLDVNESVGTFIYEHICQIEITDCNTLFHVKISPLLSPPIVVHVRASMADGKS